MEGMEAREGRRGGRGGWETDLKDKEVLCFHEDVVLLQSRVVYSIGDCLAVDLVLARSSNGDPVEEGEGELESKRGRREGSQRC